MRTVLFAALTLALALPAHVREEWLAAFTNRVLQEGHTAHLPAHLSLVLGLGSGEEAVPVRQFGTQSGSLIRTFNVASLKGQHVVVLLDYDEGRRQTHAFLLKRSGVLARAVSYETGAQPAILSPDTARPAFEAQKAWWSRAAQDAATPRDPRTR